MSTCRSRSKARSPSSDCAKELILDRDAGTLIAGSIHIVGGVHQPLVKSRTVRGQHGDRQRELNGANSNAPRARDEHALGITVILAHRTKHIVGRVDRPARAAVKALYLRLIHGHFLANVGVANLVPPCGPELVSNGVHDPWRYGREGGGHREGCAIRRDEHRKKCCIGSGSGGDDERLQPLRRIIARLWHLRHNAGITSVCKRKRQKLSVRSAPRFRRMGESQTAETLKCKRDEIARTIASYEKKLAQARADLAHINAAITIFAAGGDGLDDVPPYRLLNLDRARLQNQSSLLTCRMPPRRPRCPTRRSPHAWEAPPHS